MRFHKRIRITACLLVLLFMLATLCSVAGAQGRRTVRVGFFAFDGYHERGEDGELSGYGYEMLQYMAGYTNWKYEYVGYDKNWSEMQDMLRRGEIDLLTSAQKTEARLQDFDFSNEAIGTSSAILSVKAGDSRYLSGDYTHWSGMRVGMLEGNSRNQDLDEFSKEHGFSYTPVYFHSTEDMLRELKTGTRIDAVITSNLRSIQDEWIIAQFNASPFYIMVKKGNTELLTQIDHALSELFVEEPGLRTKLMNKYYTPENSAEIPFSAEERAFIKAMEGTTFTGILNPDREPYSYLNDGRPCGILYDVAREIIDRSGLNIQLLSVPDRTAYGRHLKDCDYDVRFDANFDYSVAEKRDYRLTGPYMDAPISRLYRKGKVGFKRAGFLGSGDISVLNRNELLGEDMEAVYYESTQALIHAVMKGECDIAYLYGSAAELAVERGPSNSLVDEKMYGCSNSYALAVKAELGPLMFSVMQKAATSMSDMEIDRIRQQYAAYAEPPFSLIRYTYDHPIHIIVSLAVLLALVGLAASNIQAVGKRKREAQRLAEEQRLNEQLSEALAAAERADMAKNRFLSSMSHEIRTPLNAVIGYNTIARNDLTEAKTDEQRRQADMRIMDSLVKSEMASKHLLNIINDVLDMSAIESGKIRVAHEPFDFKGMINSLCTLFFSQARAKGVGFEVAFEEPTEEWFVGDQLRINQILTNLLANAVKFTAEGGAVKLTIVEKTVDEKTTDVHFEITDSGIGMTKEYMERIWTPFEQAEATISRRFGGTGLGLSITKNLVDLMNGTIEVESESGVGTVFTVELSLERITQPQKAASYDFSGIRALVVDDDPGTCEYIKLLFDRCGTKCTTVTSGERALELFAAAEERGEAFNVCLIDWQMPKMDGLETVRRIHSITESKLPIIIITAYDFSEIAGEAEAAGVNMFVTKPLFQSSLFDLLANISGKRSPQKIDRNLSFDFNGARVLLVEDNAMNMEVATRILESSGLRVENAWNGREAVDKFIASKKGAYQAILMDVHMPEMNGYDATRAIRTSSHPEAASIPIIAMTADAFVENVAEAYEAGMNDHISKPIDIQRLFEVLKRYIFSKV